MFIAHQLKQQNIAEYLLYMWQIEDLIRAFNGDIDSINEHIILPMHLDADLQKQEYDWYESLIDMMRRENAMQKGHIQLVTNILTDIEECHLQQLNEGDDAFYNAQFYKILPSLVLLKSKTTNPTISDIEMCFIFLYGIMNLHRQNKPITSDTEKTATDISKFIVCLVKKYHQPTSTDLIE